MRTHHYSCSVLTNPGNNYSDPNASRDVAIWWESNDEQSWTRMGERYLIRPRLDIHPRKLYTKKCSTIEPKAKSANARSGETSLNSDRFPGLTCARREAVRTNCPTQLAKPARKALKGKLVTRTQYANCMIPENIMNTRKASTSLSRSGVF